MGANTKPGFGFYTYPIQVNVQMIEELLDRQGQHARIISARKCPVLVNGRHDIYCTKCGGRGYILDYQRQMRVVEERVRDRHLYDGVHVLKTWWAPITKIEKIYEYKHKAEGGPRFLSYARFDENEITLTDTTLPERWRAIWVTYWYDRWVHATETVISTGSATLSTTATAIPTNKTSNPEEIHGDVVQVVSATNLTTPYIYTVKGYNRQKIYLDPAAPGYVNNVGDRIALDYWYCPTTKVATEMLDTEELNEKVGYDLKVGDLRATFYPQFEIGEGDLITLLASELRKETVMVRGLGSYDELPEFDVVRTVDGFLEDETGARYIEGTDYEIREYNNLTWIDGARRPLQGKRYTLQFVYRPTYRIFLREPSYNYAENRKLPRQAYMRLFEKTRAQEFVRVDRQ